MRELKMKKTQIFFVQQMYYKCYMYIYFLSTYTLVNVYFQKP